ncbi:MAG: riboflavin synthase [Opitutaceae bacterium]|nr:riboflavin synthase [Cytophagales bacterium]
MFTGIIESLGIIKGKAINQSGNVEFEVQSTFVNELIPGQSVSHNGVCLTVTEILKNSYLVTAVPETLQRSNLGLLEIGNEINLERCLKADGRFDGHIVQGHVDTTAVCEKIINNQGYLAYFFRHSAAPNFITVEKGSVCINGISLTVVESGQDYFSVAIIPYTLENTNLKKLQINMLVNIEFDIIGKYLFKMNQNIT